ncbi:MAG: ribonuclease Y [Candidatus Moranbacteria bacterium]|nr:ribonuclease Y [Candidatus Moranbacteria bacterium]
MNSLLIGILTFVFGSGAGFTARKFYARYQLDTAESKVTKKLEDAKAEARELLLDAKDKAVKGLEEVKKEEKKRREELRQVDRRLNEKENKLNNKSSQLEKEKHHIKQKAQEIGKIREGILQIKKQRETELEKVAKLKKEGAKRELLKIAEKENKDELVKAIAELEKSKKEQIEEEAKNIMTEVMQRYAGSQVVDTTASTLSIPSDEVKGRIIGREGRNIKALENLIGVEIIVDDTPEAIVISSFDPMRREIAKNAINALIKDGRIHPTKIEEAVENAKKEINKKIKEAGEAAVYDVGLTGVDSSLTHLLGKLRYRTSYGQNVLLHSLEVAHLAGALAGELGLDVNLAKKAGLFHDIGKAVDHEIQGTHVELGINILRKFNQSEEIIDAMKSHHEDYPFKDGVGLLIAAADALSASRPGARKDTLEKYLKRLEELESLVMSFSEIEKCYAIQAGREIRVFVNSEKVDDLKALKLAKQIATKIEEDLNYPGEIKVNVLREVRSVEYAR